MAHPVKVHYTKRVFVTKVKAVIKVVYLQRCYTPFKLSSFYVQSNWREYTTEHVSAISNSQNFSNTSIPNYVPFVSSLFPLRSKPRPSTANYQVVETLKEEVDPLTKHTGNQHKNVILFCSSLVFPSSSCYINQLIDLKYASCRSTCSS